MSAKKPRKPRAPKPIYGVMVREFGYSHTEMPPDSGNNPYSTAPPKESKKKPKPPTYVWKMTYETTAPQKDNQKGEIREAVKNKLIGLGYIIKSVKYMKTYNPCLYLQVKTEQGILLFEISRL